MAKITLISNVDGWGSFVRDQMGIKALGCFFPDLVKSISTDLK